MIVFRQCENHTAQMFIVLMLQYFLYCTVLFEIKCTHLRTRNVNDNARITQWASLSWSVKSQSLRVVVTDDGQ